MYVLRYQIAARHALYAHWPFVATFICCGHGQAGHVVALFGTDCLWLVPGTIDPNKD